MHPKTLASIPKGIATTRDEAIEMAIRDYSAVARLKYISKKELLSKAMILGLCDYFDCRSIYDLAWKNIKDRPVFNDEDFGWIPPVYAPCTKHYEDWTYMVKEIGIHERLEFLKTVDLTPYLIEISTPFVHYRKENKYKEYK